MPTTYVWTTPATIATALSTEMNALANAAYSTVGSAIDNETSPSLYLDVELVLPSLTPTGSPYCSLFLVYSIDSGTNYEDVPNASDVAVAIFPFSTATAAKRKVRGNILLLPFKFKPVIQNNMGVSLAGTLNTLRYRLHNESSS